MADQFCRIACVGVCDMTLDGNLTQTLVTTDATCSFVIRDIYKVDTSTDISKTFKGDLVMDGVTVLSNLESQASGTLIIPPSSTLCYVEKSGNYPLTFTCYCLHGTLPSTASAAGYGGGLQLRLAEAGGFFASSTPITSIPCMSSMCCTNCPERGDTQWHPGTCTYIFYYHDGNSLGTLYAFCKNCTTNSSTAVFNVSTGYCEAAIANDMLGVPTSTLTCIYNWEACGVTTNSWKCICNFGGSGWSTYSNHVVSANGHPDYHCGCRAILEVRGNSATTATIKVYHFDYCTAGPGTFNANSTLMWCKYRCELPAGIYFGTDDQYFPFVYYSKYCNTWLAGTFNYGCLQILNADATGMTGYCFGDDYYYSTGYSGSVSVTCGKLFVMRNCTCTSKFIDLDSFIRGTREFSNVTSSPYTDGCTWCFMCLCSAATNNYCENIRFSKAPASSSFTGNSCDYTQADEKSSIVIYGIKAT